MVRAVESAGKTYRLVLFRDVAASHACVVSARPDCAARRVGRRQRKRVLMQVSFAMAFVPLRLVMYPFEV